MCTASLHFELFRILALLFHIHTLLHVLGFIWSFWKHMSVAIPDETVVGYDGYDGYDECLDIIWEGSGFFSYYQRKLRERRIPFPPVEDFEMEYMGIH